MANAVSKHARNYAMSLLVIIALMVILAGIYFHQIQAFLPVAAFMLALRIFLTGTDTNVRRLSGVLTIFFGASTLSNVGWYMVPEMIDLEFVQSANYYYATGMFWLAGYAAVAYVLLQMKNSRQWYIDRGLDRLITAIAVVGFFLVTLLVFLNLRPDNPNIVDIFLLLIYLCFDAIILMLTLKLLQMNLKRELKSLVFAVLIFFSINTLGDLLFECRWLYALGSLMSFNVVGLGWTLTVRNTTDLIYEVSLLLMIGGLLLYLIDPFRNRALDDTRRRLRDTQLFVDDLVAKSPDATCIFGQDGRLLLANDAFLHIFGLDRKNVSSTYNVFGHMSKASQTYPVYGQIERVREGETVIIPKIKINQIMGGRHEPFLYLPEDVPHLRYERPDIQLRPDHRGHHGSCPARGRSA